MLDNHFVPEGYGIIPNFNIFGLNISTYTFFVGLSLIVAITWFYLSIDKKVKNNINNTNIYNIVLFALLFGFIGSKILVIIENFDYIVENIHNVKDLQSLLLTGKSIVGGLIGGYIGVRFIKKRLNIENIRMGNKIAPSIALGMAIGRIGCFLTGCCFGIETSLPIGVDFGDGINRIPTQLIECLFCITLFIYLFYKQRTDKDLMPGILFKKLVLSYFIFRFLIEFVRGTLKNIIFLSIYQVICLIGIIYILRKMFKEKLLWESKRIKE